MNGRAEAVRFLRAPRPRWVDMEVEVSPVDVNGAVMVTARHTTFDRRVVGDFRCLWADPDRQNTEYGWGLSVVHDARDHIFFGIGFTPLTEVQTMVQNFYGWEMAGGRVQRPGDHLDTLREHIYHELYAPQGRPLVYDPAEQRGTLDLYAPDTTSDEREDIYMHLCIIAETIMLPHIRAAYEAFPLVLGVQGSMLDQPELVDTFLEGIRWDDRSRFLLNLRDNAGFHGRWRAYVCDDLAAISKQIAEEAHAYSVANDLQALGGKIFSIEGHCLLGVDAFARGSA